MRWWTRFFCTTLYVSMAGWLTLHIFCYLRAFLNEILHVKPCFHSNALQAAWLLPSINDVMSCNVKRLRCVRCVQIESILSLRFLAQGPLASVAWLALAYFCFFLLAYFSLRKALRALRAFEWKSGLTRSVSCVPVQRRRCRPALVSPNISLAWSSSRDFVECQEQRCQWDDRRRTPRATSPPPAAVPVVVVVVLVVESRREFYYYNDNRLFIHDIVRMLINCIKTERLLLNRYCFRNEIMRRQKCKNNYL